MTLAGGLWREGEPNRHAVLRELDPNARGELLEAGAAALPAERITGLLQRALVSVGDVTAIGPQEVRQLRIGDRDRLVLALRRMQHGDRLSCVFDCGCGERLELELDVGALLGEDTPGAGPVHATATTATAAGEVEVQVRAATGQDHERAARRALADPAAAARELLQACVIAARGPDGEPVAIEREVAECAEDLLAELDPGAELLLAGDCPACGDRVTARFDPITHLWAEFEQRRAQLEHEVHVLALHYHWSEREIVALTPARRARYLNRLDLQRPVR
jgi:hypothetical protein